MFESWVGLTFDLFVLFFLHLSNSSSCSGQFAVVHRVVERSTKTEYAAKYIKKKRVETSRRGVAMGDIEKEIHILAEMENENIIYLHQVYENAQFVILIIEL